MPLDIAALSKGEIGGRVVDVNGRPLNSVPISLVPADVPVEQILSEGKWITATTDKQGRYRFTQLAAGRYLLIVNRTEQGVSHRSDLARSLPRLFYPGVNDLGGATVIVVGKDDEPREYEFRLPVQQ
ncbi:MAG: carboxypeptidase-like regulatory domain-containing protein [Acidobacteria bacterium]|nr:carboxypeptidase-like regulatory domain-containing protein [Acidobacteriota bacterium]